MSKTVEIHLPANVPVTLYRQLRGAGVRHNDAVRALQQRAGDRAVREALTEQNRRGQSHSVIDAG